MSFDIKLRDDEILVLNALPRSASYRITESASDHIAQYNIVSTNNDQTDKAVFTETGHTPGGSDADHLGVANTRSDQQLATKVEFVDRYDGTVTVIFQNNRDLATVTGVPGLDYMVYAVTLAVLGVMVFITAARRRSYENEEIDVM